MGLLNNGQICQAETEGVGLTGQPCTDGIVQDGKHRAPGLEINQGEEKSFKHLKHQRMKGRQQNNHRKEADHHRQQDSVHQREIRRGDTAGGNLTQTHFSVG